MRGRLPVFLGVLLLAAGARAQPDDIDLAEGVTLERLAAGLAMPVDIAVAADGSVYFAELMTGALRRIPAGADAPGSPLWVAPDLQTGVERGFMGLALAGDFDTSGKVFVFYTHNASGTITNRLSSLVDGVETPMLWDLPSSKVHNGGRILPLADGTLLVSLGDITENGKTTEDSMHARDPAVLQGKVLRLLPDGNAAPGNPLGGRVWTMGHRNVYGLAAAPDGTVLATENGPDRGDEINVLRAGADYGWPTCIGPCDEPGVTSPVLHYTPPIAPTGAVWFRGAFYFSDFNDGMLHRVHPQANGTWADEPVLKLHGRAQRILDVAAGTDALYFVTWSEMYRVTLDERWILNAPAAPTPPGAPGASPASPDEPVGGRAAAEIPAGGVAMVAVAAAAAAIALARLRR